MLNLMLVDDEPIILKGLINIIGKGNIPCTKIVSATDGIDALEKLQTFRPDLIITDIQMPEMSGLELIKQAQERNLCERFIILTGYDETTYLRQAIRFRVIDYLLKPINKIELYNVLSNLSVELLGRQKKSGEENGESSLPPSVAGMPELEADYLSKNVKKIIHYIDEHYSEDLSLDQIAEHVYLHPNYISSLFKKETGLTFINYLHLFRIKKAKELIIRNADLSFHLISEQVGYENVRHFFSVFKKYSGVTPGEYRDLYKLH